MNSKYMFVYILTGIGFFASLLASVASGASFKMVLLRVLLSSAVLSIAGFFFVFIADKFNFDTNKSLNSSNGNDKFSKNLSHSDIENEIVKRDALVDHFTETSNLGGKTRSKTEESNEDISYENIFKALEQETMLENTMNRTFPSHATNTVQPSVENKAVDGIEKSVLDDIKQEYETGQKEFVVGKNQIDQVIVGDKDMQNYINEDEKQQIVMTTSQLHSSGNIKEIDEKFIHLPKESKIENNPEKIAQVIKNLIKDEEEK